jgi:NADPH-dependent 2,4-dienoyl-CoA reductase/sulfur reductase-like enzyme
MAEHHSYVIVGNGIAGITAAETLRQEQPSAEITIIAETPTPACYRPALKDYLVERVSEETLFARRPGFYADKGMHFQRGGVVNIAINQHKVLLRSGQSINYDRLLLAAGARARRLTCPGSDLAGALTLRAFTDYQAARRFMEIARRVVVCGAGPLALETVDKLRQRGLPVTHLLRSRRLWPGALDRTASELILHQEQEAEVDVRFEEEIAEIIGWQGQVMGIITNNGKRIPCEMLVMAIGSEPVIDFIKASGIACACGVTVDHAMRTSAVDIYAAGDVAEMIDPLTGQTRISGQWYPAMQQGRAAAYSMLGMLDTPRLRHATKYSNAYLRPINTLSVFGLDVAAIGLTKVSAPGCQEVMADPRTHIYSKALLKDGVPVGMLSFDDRRDTLAFKRAIDHAVNLTSVVACLFNYEFKLATWLDAQKVPAPVLAVRKMKAPLAPSPARSMKSQFVPTAPRLEAPGEYEEEDFMEIKPRANSDPYTLPAISVTRPRPVESVPTDAFLAPVLPARTARMLLAGDELDRASTLAFDRENPDKTVAPEWVHTPLSQTSAVTIGREAGSTVVINHQSISRRHAEITCVNGTYLLRDLGSRNGTFVNETRLAAGRDYALKPRDQIRIGNLMTYQFQLRTGS